MSARPRLRDALLEVAGERNGEINARRLGRYLTRQLRRIEGGMRFEDAGIDRISCRRLFKVASVTSVSSVSPCPTRAMHANHGVWSGTDADNADNDGVPQPWK